MDLYHFNLNNEISVDVKHFSPIAVGSEVYRVIYEIREAATKKLFKFYEIWLSLEYVEDHKKPPSQIAPTQNGILSFANNYLKERYSKSNNSIPEEDGAFLTNELGESLGNPRTFPLKLKDEKRPSYVTTTIRLPEDTHKWLVDYGREQNVGLGESIRRLVGNYAAGTASVGMVNEEKNK